MSDKWQPNTGHEVNAEVEGRLRVLFCREDAPVSLTQRIVRLARERRALPRPAKPLENRLRRYAPALSVCAALITVCAFIAAGMVHRRRIEMTRAQEARAQLLYALHMTTGELEWAEHRLNQDLAAPSVAPSKSGGGPTRGPAPINEKLEDL